MLCTDRGYRLIPAITGTASGRIAEILIVVGCAGEDALPRLLDESRPVWRPVPIDAGAFADLPEEIGLRLLGRLIAWTGAVYSFGIGLIFLFGISDRLPSLS